MYDPSMHPVRLDVNLSKKPELFAAQTPSKATRVERTLISGHTKAYAGKKGGRSLLSFQ